MRGRAVGAVVLSACGAVLCAPASPVGAVTTALVVNEVKASGLNGELDEFLELRNVGAQPLDVSGYEVRAHRPNCAVEAVVAIPPGTVLDPGAMLVFVNEGFTGTVPPEATLLRYTSPSPVGLLLGPQGSVSVADQDGVVDGLAWTTELGTTACRQEGQAARGPTSPFGTESLSRDTASTDTDDNRRDFTRTPATPGAPTGPPAGADGPDAA
ncbi:lamin tail domain-containing protein [Actinosynnema sp. NPDC050436]|uniref:lamin tail domain-containing protein n=1 Tax=Actinosynnema sp. NPDC050436 TaxID=3155659 RepID=UPI0033D77D0D